MLRYFSLALFTLSPSIFGHELITPNYSIQITIECEEGNVTCDQVRYLGRSKHSLKQLELVGHTQHTLCADGITPCTFLGYQFENNGVRYFVSEQGRLVVTDQEGKILVDETGEWH